MGRFAVQTARVFLYCLDLARLAWNSHFEVRSQGRNVVLAAIVLLYVIVAFMKNDYIESLAAKFSDRHLLLGLYIVGAAFAGLGALVSVAPPKSRWSRYLCFLLFLLFFHFGILIANEQGHRAEQATLNTEIARAAEEQQKAQYNKDVLQLRNQIDGLGLAITAVAKGSPDPKWSKLLLQTSQAALQKGSSGGQSEDPRLVLFDEAAALDRSLRSFQMSTGVAHDQLNERLDVEREQMYSAADRAGAFNNYREREIAELVQAEVRNYKEDYAQ